MDAFKAANIKDIFVLVLCNDIINIDIHPELTAVIIIFEYKIEDSQQMKDLFAYIASRKSYISFISVYIPLFCAPEIDDSTLIVTVQNRFYVGLYHPPSFENCFNHIISNFITSMSRNHIAIHIVNPPITFCHTSLFEQKSNELYKEMKSIYDANSQKRLRLIEMFFHASS